MKFVRGKDGVKIRFGLMEIRMFLQLIGLYPRVPPAHYRLSRNSKVPDAEASQALLEEALAEQRAANRESILKVLKDPECLKPAAHGGMTLVLGYPDVECLLQVLNDLRVGSWIRMGSPEDIDGPYDESKSDDSWVMQVAGYFESQILDCLQGRDK